MLELYASGRLHEHSLGMLKVVVVAQWESAGGGPGLPGCFCLSARFRVIPTMVPVCLLSSHRYESIRPRELHSDDTSHLCLRSK